MEFSTLDILLIFASVVVGLVVGYFINYIRSRFELRVHKRELKEYKEHLNRQMKITDLGNKNLEQDLQDLKKENENLRISVKTLGQKPGRAELRLLNIYDGALRKMMLKAPGFSSAWEVALQEAEKEYEDNEKGFKSIIKKVFGPSITHRPEIIDVPSSKEGFR
ncbi:MAG: LapA family protein [Sulfurimonas sp.]|nr:LapA family protein [Sulfurimonas sp.]